MNTGAFKLKLLLLAAMVWCAALVQAQTFEKSRVVKKSFKVEDQTEIQIVNKYGNINLIPWDQDSVKFEIELTVKSKKESKVEKTFEYIDFEFKANEYYVIAQTIFLGQGNFWSDVSDLAGSLFSSSTVTRIDYQVYFPKNNELKIENKFGDIYTTDHHSKIDIELSNGDLKAHAFKGDTRIRVEFGNASIEEIDRGRIFLNYAEMTIEKSDFLDIESKSSKLWISEAEDISINSKRDRFKISSMQSISGTSSYSYLDLKEVSKKIDLNTNYGDLNIESMPVGFKFLSVESKYTDIIINVKPDAYYDVEILHNEKTQITFPADASNQKESTVNEEEKIYKIEFEIGEAGNFNIPVNLKTKSGTVHFKLP